MARDEYPESSEGIVGSIFLGGDVVGDVSGDGVVVWRVGSFIVVAVVVVVFIS